MKHTDLPVNLSILQINPTRLETMRPVTSLDIFDGATDNFHPNGLFSLEIFGRVGSDGRDTRFSFVDLKVDIFHPFIYKQICLLKQLYGGIMSGKAYAIWNDNIKDFESSDPIHGQTGFYFFLTKWRQIEFKATGSDIRDLRIKLIDKYSKLATMSKVLIMPAGLRDIEITESGQHKQGEINDHYRSLIAISNTLSTMGDKNTPVLDQSRYSLMMAFNRVYDYIHDLLEGKNGFMAQKVGARRVYNGTRNVITAMDTSSESLDQPNSPGIDSTVVGLYQLLNGILPVAKHLILNGWCREIFHRETGTATLVNRQTWKREVVQLDAQTIDKWTTTAGIESLIKSLRSMKRRSSPVMLNGYYIGLVYTSSDPTQWERPVFKFFGDITELPFERGLTKKDVRPITLYELLYVAGYTEWHKYPVFVTRYPIAGVDSIYPSIPYVKTTVEGVVRTELNDRWEIGSLDRTALEYPDPNCPNYIDTMSPHSSRLQGLGGDFDGDTCSGNFVYTQDSQAEVAAYLNTRAAYINSKGKFKNSLCVETVERVFANFTAD